MNKLGRYREAKKHLAHAFDIASWIKSKLLTFYVFLAKALFAMDKGAKGSGLKLLKKALTIGKEQGYFNLPIDQPCVMAGLCVIALDAKIEVEYVQDFILKRHLIPDDPPIHLENWPWAVKIFTLGRFSLLKDGKPVIFSRKTQKIPLLMLKTLIAFGGREVKDERIADVMWPDADGDAALGSFSSTLHRLRKLLGYDKAIELRNGYLTLNQRYCWVDVWAFERIFGQADAAWKEATGCKAEEAIELTQKAIDIYHGHFMEGESGEPWADSLNERLRSKFFQGVEKLGHYLETVEQWNKALECYQNGLKKDGLAEIFYQRLMVCYHRLGRGSEALLVYDRCKRILNTTLGIEPSPKTKAIRKSHLSF